MNNSMPDQNTTIQTVTDVLDGVPMHLVTCLYCGGSWLYAGANLAREQAATHQCDVNAPRSGDVRTTCSRGSSRPGTSRERHDRRSPVVVRARASRPGSHQHVNAPDVAVVGSRTRRRRRAHRRGLTRGTGSRHGRAHLVRGPPAAGPACADRRASVGDHPGRTGSAGGRGLIPQVPRRTTAPPPTPLSEGAVVCVRRTDEAPRFGACLRALPVSVR